MCRNGSCALVDGWPLCVAVVSCVEVAIVHVVDVVQSAGRCREVSITLNVGCYREVDLNRG